LPSTVGAALEIVIDGLDTDSISHATAAGVKAACDVGRKRGIVAISAGNYGGNLGPYHFRLREILK